MARRGNSRGTGRGTPIFSFETPSRERTSRINRGARELLRDIVGSNHGSPSSSTSVTTTDRLSEQNNSPTGVTTPTPALHVNNTASEEQLPRETPLTNVSTAAINSTVETSDFSREIRHLREQQKKLAASSARIEELLKTLATSKENSIPRAVVPRELSALVRDVYNKLTDEENVEWNYLASFDDESNKEVTSLLIRNVLGVTKDVHDFSIIKRAARTYFKTRKSAHQRKRTGKERTTAIAAHHRQRKHNKAHARLRALNLSTTLSSDDKEKIRPVLKADFMSSDESDHLDADNTTRSGGSSDNDGGNGQLECEQTQRKKKLIRHRLPWRSQELQLIVERRFLGNAQIELSQCALKLHLELTPVGPFQTIAHSGQSNSFHDSSFLTEVLSCTLICDFNCVNFNDYFKIFYTII